MQLAHIPERPAAHHLASAPTRRKASCGAGGRPVPSLSRCRDPRRRAASAETIRRFVEAPDRAPQGSSFTPFTILLARLLPIAADEADARKFLSSLARSIRDFCRRRGVEGGMTWCLENDALRSLHAHGSVIVPHTVAAEARRFLREAVARRAGVSQLPPHALHIHAARGSTGTVCAKGWARYAAKTLPEPGVTVAGVTGRRALGRPVQGRRCSSPRFRPRTLREPLTQPIAAPLAAPLTTAPPLVPARVPSLSRTPLREIISGLSAAISREFPMPATRRTRRRLHGLRVTEISLCTNGHNDGAKVLIAKADDGEAVTLEIVETDADRRYIAGWASIIERDGEEVEDSEGDVLDIETLRAAATDFIASSRKGAVRHRGSHDAISWSESVVMDADTQKAMGVELGFVGWWVGGTINDDETWKAVKSQKLRSLSIGGTAERRPVEKSRTAGRARTLDEVLKARGYDPARMIAKARPAPKRDHCADCPNRGRTGTADPCRIGCQLERAARPVRKSGMELGREALARRRAVPATDALQRRADAAEVVSKARPTDAVAHARHRLLANAAATASSIAKGTDRSTPATPRTAADHARLSIAARIAHHTR